jgi:hypothetical protein
MSRGKMQNSLKPLWCKINGDGLRIAAFDRSELEMWMRSEKDAEMHIYDRGEYFATLRANAIWQDLFSDTSPNPSSQDH